MQPDAQAPPRHRGSVVSDTDQSTDAVLIALVRAHVRCPEHSRGSSATHSITSHLSLCVALLLGLYMTH